MPNGDIFEDLASKYFVKVLNSLLPYKVSATHVKLKGAPHCNIPDLSKQISNVVECDVALKNMWKQRDQFPSDSLEFGPTEGYIVERKPDPDVSNTGKCC
jgi:hypothetical protein